MLTRAANSWSIIRIMSWPILTVILLSACQIQHVEEKPAIPTTLYLTPYFTPTPQRTDTPATRNIATATPRPFPTATPFTYVVVQGDTMLGIAMRYGIELAELMNANPEVNPRVLSIGTELIIPESGEFQEAFAIPTPIPMQLSDPLCYRTTDGGVWCLLSVENNRKEAVENVFARISLSDSSGALITESEATTPLNVIPGYQSMPVVAFFPPPLPYEIVPQADMISVLPLLEEDDRYLKVSIDLEKEHYLADNLQATLSGSILLAADQDEATIVWLVVVAYDESGAVVGVRKWEALYVEDGELPTQIYKLQEPLQAGKKLHFEVDVFSLGPSIAYLEVFVEARR
jgi:LysM repeat protein